VSLLIFLQEPLRLQDLQGVAAEVEHLGARIHALGQVGELLAPALHRLLAALPLAHTHLGRTGEAWGQKSEQ